MIILEGPDGAGKTFTAKRLSCLSGKKIGPVIGPPKNSEEIFKRLHKMIKINRDLIYDRCDIICEPIYGNILRNKNLLEDSWKDWQPFLFEVDVSLVYCRPSTETIFKTKLKTKSWKSPGHLASVKENLLSIIIAYDRMMLNFDVTYFNRDTTTIEELFEALRL